MGGTSTTRESTTSTGLSPQSPTTSQTATFFKPGVLPCFSTTSGSEIDVAVLCHKLSGHAGLELAQVERVLVGGPAGIVENEGQHASCVPWVTASVRAGDQSP